MNKNLFPGVIWDYLDSAYRPLTESDLPMPRGRISKRSVDALSCPRGKDRRFLWDDALAGFGAAAYPTGKKVYVVQFRKGGRSRRVSIGDHGRLTPEQARSQAKKLLGGVEQGDDPVLNRRKARAVRTFREVAVEFMTMHVKAKRKLRTHQSYDTLLQRHILPAIGNARIVDLRRTDIGRMHSRMIDTPGAANRALSLISSIWNWAARRDEVAFEGNPARGLERNPEVRCERFLTAEELRRLGDVLVQAETVGIPYEVDETGPTAKHAPKRENRLRTVDRFAVAAIRLLIFSGARLREILHAKWQEVDLARGIIHLSESKTGRKPLYLSAAARELLAGLPRIEGNPYVIPGWKQGAPRSDLKKPWAAVTKGASLEGLRIHDLRHTFASLGAAASLGLPILGKLLGHATPATTARYAHLDADPMRRAADTIGATIEAAMSHSRS